MQINRVRQRGGCVLKDGRVGAFGERGRQLLALSQEDRRAIMKNLIDKPSEALEDKQCERVVLEMLCEIETFELVQRLRAVA